VFQAEGRCPGLQASVDYYSIKISNLISSLSAQQEVDACYYKPHPEILWTTCC